MRARRYVWVGAFFGSLGFAAACGGDDSNAIGDADAGDGAAQPDTTTPPFDAGSPVDDTGAPDTTVADTGTDTAASDAVADTAASDANNDATDAPNDAPTDGPRTLDGALCNGGSITTTSVAPQFGWTGGTTPITVTGTGFVATPKVYLRNSSTQALTPIVHAAYVSSTSMTALVPTGLPVATYDVGVANPDGCAAYIASAFKVLQNPPPTIVSISPGAGTTQVNTNVTVTGCHFPANAALATVDLAGTVVAQTAQAATCTGATNVCADASPLCTFSGTIASTTLAVGAYLVRVKNPGDLSFDEYGSFVVTNPAQKLTGSYTAASPMNTGRRALGVVGGRINDANRFLYAVGGENTAGTALANVEVAPLDRFGQVGKWFVQKNTMNVARSGLVVVRQGQYLYALGGTSGTDGTKGTAPTGTPLGSIERARILDPSQAPVVTDPPLTGAGGTLAIGTWYYKVSAVMGVGNADNPSGETLASDEVIANVTAAGTVTLAWSAVTGADHYRVYRSSVVNGTSQSEVLIQGNVAALTYADTGAAAAGTEVPLATGSTGVWINQTTALLHPRLNAAAAVGPDGAGGSRVYLVGGWGSCSAANSVMACSEATSVTAAGDALGGVFTEAGIPGSAVLDAGVAGAFTARMRHSLSVLTPANAPSGTPANSNFLVIGGGYGPGVSSGLVEYAPIVSTAIALSPWQQGNTTFSQARDGTQIAIVNGEAYDFMGGTAPNQYTGTGTVSALGAVTTSSVTFGPWSSSAVALPGNAVLGRFGLTVESAYFYVVGGTSNDADALTTVYQILY